MAGWRGVDAGTEAAYSWVMRYGGRGTIPKRNI